MSCAECERANQGLRMARVKRLAALVLVLGVAGFVAWQQLRSSPAQLPASPTSVQRK